MKKAPLFLLLILLPAALFGEVVKMDLSDAIKNHAVKMSAVNFAGLYKGKTTRLTVTNNNNSAIMLKINLGVILKPDDSSYQPMVLTGEEILVIEPHREGSVDVQTFCGNSPLSCPQKDMHYAYSHLGTDALVKVLKFIKTNALYDELGQSAVWVITNNHSPGSVYDPERDALSKKLINYLCGLTNSSMPEYFTRAATAENIRSKWRDDKKGI